MEECFGPGDLLIDLYAGVGTHGLALRRLFRHVLCGGGGGSSGADARSSLESGRATNVEIIANPRHRTPRRLKSEKAEAFILNPSAVGADPPALEAVTTSTARSVAYLSCDPETLARDLAILIDGGFKLVTVQAIDMMPQTRQIECLALLRR